MELNFVADISTADLQAVKSFLTRPAFLKDEFEYAQKALSIVKDLKVGINAWDLDEALDEIGGVDVLDDFMYNYVSFSVYSEVEEKEIAYVTPFVQSILFFRAKCALHYGRTYEDVAEWFRKVRLHIRKDVWLGLYTNFHGYITQTTV